MTERAWLHRGTKPSWEFQRSKKHGQLTHTTRAGTVYAILPGLDCYWKPFWVARLVGDAWYTVESELRATSIVFEGAGEYVFPKRERAAT